MWIIRQRLLYNSRKCIFYLLFANIYVRTYLLTFLASYCLPSGVIREAESERQRSLHSVHCHQPLDTCPPGGPRAFYVTFLQYIWYCEFQPRSPPISLTAHFSIMNFPILLSLIRSMSPNQLRTIFFNLTVTSLPFCVSLH